MKKKLFLLLIVGLVALFSVGVLSSCTRNKTIEVPLPEVIDDADNNCDHVYDEGVFFEATCIERAHTEYTCEICGNKYSIYEGELGEHVLTTVHEAGTCISYGSNKLKCTVCGQVVSEEDDATYGDHSYEKVNKKVAGTCQTIGYTIVKRCKYCKDEVIEEGTYGSHRLGTPVHVEPTCISEGYDEATCTVCKQYKERYNVVEPSGHDFVETTVPGADCQHKTAIVSRCKNCSLVETKETALYGPHSFAADGSEKHSCSLCGLSVDHTVVYRNVSDASHLCYCDVCGYQHATESHAYGDPVSVAATCTTAGSVSYACEKCRHAYTVVLPAKHNYSVSDVSVTSCSETGRVTLTCDVCNKTITQNYLSSPASTSVGVAPALRLPAGASVERSGNYVYFGSYPSVRMTDPTVVNALNALAGALPTPADPAAWSVASYCSGAPYSWFTDVTRGGKKYRGVYFTAYRPSVLTSGTTANNSYLDDNGYLAGTVYWFEYEKIRWNVLSDNTDLLLFSAAVLDAQALNGEPAVWADCDLKNYLSSDFFDLAFTADEKSLIGSTDNLFLLSASDIVSTEYGFSAGNVFCALRSLAATDYALSQGLYSPCRDASGVAFWLTPSSAEFDAYEVSASGYYFERAFGHTFTETISSLNLRSAATCIEYATYYKICSVCGALSEEYFTDEADGYALHSYAYTHTAASHRYACVFCDEELLEEPHTLSYVDDLNGLSHTAYCAVCGYEEKENHAFTGAACSVCSAEKPIYTTRWDVSGGTNAVMAYLSGTTLTLLGKGNMADYSAQNPAPYSSYRQTITTVVFGDSVTSVGAYAFYNFPALTSITIPEQTEKIGKNAFAFAENVSSLVYNARSCGSFSANNGVFANVGKKSSSLTVTIGEKVEAVPSYLFCPSFDTLPRITALTVDGSAIASVGDYAFYGLSLPVGVSLPAVETIGKYAFYNNAAATSFVLGDYLTSVGEYAFYGCERTTFNVGSSLTSIGECAFSGCKRLTSVSLAATVIPDYAFYNSGLDYLTISVAPTSIGRYAFCNAPLTTLLSVGSTDNLFAAATSVGEYAFCGTGLQLTISSSLLVSVGDYAFYGCEKLRSVTLPALTSLGKYAFAECPNMFSFSADTVTSVPEGCFAGDSALRHAVFPSLVGIGKEAFLSCYRLNSFTLPATLASIDVNAFKGCFTLVELDNRSSLTLSAGAVSNGYAATYAKHIYNGATGGSSLLQNQGRLVILQLDEPWIVGYSGDFEYSPSLTLEYNVAAYAFYKVSYLDYVIVRSNVVERYAFYGAKDMTTVCLENDCLVEEKAFASCENLQCVYFETDPASVDVTAFYDDVIALMSFPPSLFTALTESEIFSTINAQKLEMGIYSEETIPDIEGYTGETNNSWVVYTRVAAPVTISGAVTPTITYTLTKTHPNGYDLSVDGDGAMPDYTADTVPWKDYIDNVIGLSVSAGITRIGAYALYGASSLSSISWFDDTVTSVGDYAFYGCSSLNTVIFPDNLTSIGNHAFENCSSANDLFFNATLSSIGEYAFAGCEEAFSIQLHQGVTSIGAHSFEGCKNMMYLFLPASLSSIGEYAFAGCINLISIEFDCENCADFARDNYVFYNCGQAGSGIALTIGDNVDYIPAYLFNPVFDLKYPSPRITAISIPHSLAVGDYAFRNVTSAATIDLTYASSIGRGVLSGTAPSSVLLSVLTQPLGYFFDGNNASVPASLATITLVSSASVPEDAFAGCSSLVTVNLPFIPGATVTVGARAYKDCSTLEAISLRGGDIEVGEEAFAGCSALGSVQIVSGTETATVGDHAFARCSSLAEFSASPLSSVGKGAFLGCERVASFSCSGTSVAVHQNSGAFGIYSLSSVSATLVGFVGQASYTIPATVGSASLPVTVIGEEAFSSLTNLRTVVVCDTVTSIEENAFLRCSALRTVSFGTNTVLNTVGKKAFFECTELREISLPSSVQVVSDSAFEGCTSLASFTLPAETITLGERAFASCRKLRAFTFGGRNLRSLPQGAFSSCVLLSAITLPSGLEIVNENAFEQCSSLVSVDLPNGLKQIRASAFSHCKNLVSLSLPNSVVSLGEKVFNGCVGLEELQFGTGISSLGMGVLSGCKNLRTLTLPFVGASSAETRTFYPFGYIFGTVSYDGAVKTTQSIVESTTVGSDVIYSYASVAYYLPLSLSSITIKGGVRHAEDGRYLGHRRKEDRQKSLLRVHLSRRRRLPRFFDHHRRGSLLLLHRAEKHRSARKGQRPKRRRNGLRRQIGLHLYRILFRPKQLGRRRPVRKGQERGRIRSVRGRLFDDVGAALPRQRQYRLYSRLRFREQLLYRIVPARLRSESRRRHSERKQEDNPFVRALRRVDFDGK